MSESVANNVANNYGVPIKPRAMSFPFEQISQRDYFDNNRLISAFGAALSSVFPPGEAEFIASVRLYRDRVKDEKLQQEIRGFIGQEGHHSHQHKKINQVFKERGWDAVRLEEFTKRDLERLNRGRQNAPKLRLALTVCMEHLTAIMSEFLLNNQEVLAPAEEPMRDLLYWHAVEEIEHKAVAFDVFMQCEGDQTYLRRVMRLAGFSFWTRMMIYTAVLLWWNKTLPSWKELKGFGRFLFGKRGMLRLTRKPYKDFFKPGFHPWDHNNKELIEQWKNHLYKASCDKNSAEYQQANPGVKTA